MGILKEFRDFAMRGKVVDMAVGVIIGAAFGKIVTSLVSDVLMPPIGKLIGNVSFNDLFYALDPSTVTSLEEARKQGVAVVGYGAFITTIIDFLIVAFCIFMVIKAMNTLKDLEKKKEPAAAPSTRECPEYCSTINVKAKRCPQCAAEIPVA